MVIKMKIENKLEDNYNVLLNGEIQKKNQFNKST